MDEDKLLSVAATLYPLIAGQIQAHAKAGGARDQAIDDACKESVFVAYKLANHTAAFLAALNANEETARNLTRRIPGYAPDRDPHAVRPSSTRDQVG